MHTEPVFWPDVDRRPHSAAVASPWFCDRVREVVETCLTDKQREVVELHFFMGWTEDRIASHLGIRQQVVHKRLHGVRRHGRHVGGAMRKLRHALLPLARTLRWE